MLERLFRERSKGTKRAVVALSNALWEHKMIRAMDINGIYGAMERESGLGERVKTCI
jgi:hypothetical protein